MEDFIYIIALIAWVVFAFYRKSQKKAEEARKTQTRRQPDGPSKPFPTLEEILMGKEVIMEEEEEPYFEEPVLSDGMSPVLKETAFEREYKLRGITSIEELDRATEGKGPVMIKLQEEEEEVEESAYDWRQDFDVRQAVIYAEILNRPYA
jgi:hypothetical protein